MELWLYVDALTGQQKGPLPAHTLKRLLRKGLLQPQQFVWTQRLDAWQALADVADFSAYCATWSCFWYYMVDDLEAAASGATGAEATKQAGPASTKELVALFLDGEVDGMTLVWTKDMVDWKPISALHVHCLYGTCVLVFRKRTYSRLCVYVCVCYYRRSAGAEGVSA